MVADRVGNYCTYLLTADYNRGRSWINCATLAKASRGVVIGLPACILTCTELKGHCCLF